MRRFGLAIGAVALLLGGMWIAVNESLLPDSAEAVEKFLAVFYQCIRVLPKLGPLWLSVLGLGIFIRNRLAPNAKSPITIQIVAGLGAMLMLDWLLAVFGLLNAWTAWAILGLGTAVITYHFADSATRDKWHPDNWPSPPWTVLLALPALGMLIVACICPPGTLWSIEAFGYDVMSYHLQIPTEWMRHGAMTPLPYNVYSYLPSLAEAGYLKLAIMHGSVYDAIYTAQLFHASVAVVAAVSVGKFVGRSAGPVPGALAGAALLAMPWVLITGSMAYDEMFVLAFGAGAMMLVFDPGARNGRGALLIGMLLGLAMLAKLTAAGFIVLPVIVVLAMRWLRDHPAEPRPEGRGPKDEQQSDGNAQNEARPEARTLPGGASCLRLLAFVGLGLLLTLSPYLIRNIVWTGNPVFPFATSLFGKAHWNDTLVKRWNDAHHSAGLGEGLAQLGPRWLLSPGYGAMGPPREDELGSASYDITQFPFSGILPTLWILAGIGAVILWKDEKRHTVVRALLVMLGVQLLFWLLATHHQSRFLIPTLLPGCALAAMGVGRIGERTQATRPNVMPIIAVTWLLILSLISILVLFDQTIPFRGEDGKIQGRFPVWRMVDTLIERADVTTNQPGRAVGNHPLNELPNGSRVLIVADVGNLIYIRVPHIYNTAFDHSLLGEILRQYKHNPSAVTAALSKLGVTHIWLDLGEITRLDKTYGVDDALKPEKLVSFLDQVMREKRWIMEREVGLLPVNPPKYLFRIAPIMQMRFIPAPSGEEKKNPESEKKTPQ